MGRFPSTVYIQKPFSHCIESGSAPSKNDVDYMARWCNFIYWFPGDKKWGLKMKSFEDVAITAVPRDAKAPEKFSIWSPMGPKSGAEVNALVQDLGIADPGADMELIDFVENSQGLHAFVVRARNTIIVVFRGTADGQDMCSDVSICRTQLEQGGLVVSGFQNQLAGDGALTTILDQVFKLWNADTTRPIRVTGHSLGAAQATLCALEISTTCVGADLNVITFGEPRVGNSEFRDRCLNAKMQHIRVQNELDVITRIPYWFPCPGIWHHSGFHVWLRNGDVEFGHDQEPIPDASIPLICCVCCRGIQYGSSVPFHKLGGDVSYMAHLDSISEESWQSAWEASKS